MINFHSVLLTTNNPKLRGTDIADLNIGNENVLLSDWNITIFNLFKGLFLLMHIIME